MRQMMADRGLRFTRQRACVLEALEDGGRHPTAEEVHRRVRKSLPAVSLATIYKSLDALVDVGLARKLNAGDGPARYDAIVVEHPHLRDMHTGQLMDLPGRLAERMVPSLPAELLQEIQRETGFEVCDVRVELVGRAGAKVSAV